MGIKKIARPLNNAKNKFVEWLKDNRATDIDVYEGEKSDEWDYYRHVSASIGNTLLTAYFTMWNGQIKVDYSDEENKYNDMSIEDFLQLLY